MKTVLVSRKFNPGHLSHMLANRQLMVGAGYSVLFGWHKSFRLLSNGIFKNSEISKNKLITLKLNNLVFVWFPSISALIDMLLVRCFTKATIVYIFHEPFSSFHSYRVSGFGFFKTIKITLVSVVNYFLVTLSHKIILPSTTALTTFEARYDTNKAYEQFPLMFDDETKGHILVLENRKYIAYIGTVAEDHAFDEFVKFACYVLSNQLLADGQKMLIATRSVLSSKIMAQLQNYVDTDLLVIQSGRPLSTEEINFFYARSFVVWNAYRRSMQSGVLPKAYMFGTPVIISSANRSEFFDNGVTGIEVSNRYDCDEILSAVRLIIANFPAHSLACRTTFLEKFYYKAFSNKFIEFVTT
jgi:hypothetical protein